MIFDKINLVEPEEIVKEGERVSRNKIKTQPSTFSKIKSFFRNWRLSRQERKLEKKQDKFRNMEFSANPTGDLSEKDKKAIKKDALKIAEIERKIKILREEKVPVTYVADRALKIKRNMMKAIEYTTDGMYRILDEKEKAALFEETPTKPIVNPTVTPKDNSKTDEKAIDVEETSAMNKEAIASVIEGAMSSIKQEESNNTEEEIRKTVSQNIADSDSKTEDINQDNKKGNDESERIGTEEIESVINSYMSGMNNKPQEKNNVEGPQLESNDGVKLISPSDVAQEVGAIEKPISKDETINDNIRTERDNNPVEIPRVSKNASSNAKVNNFDEQGNVKKNNTVIKSKTEDTKLKEVEIIEEAAKHKTWEAISSDEMTRMKADLQKHFIEPYNTEEYRTKYNIPSNNQTAKREEPIVTPERNEERILEKNDAEAEHGKKSSLSVSDEEFESAKRKVAESQKRIERAEERQRETRKLWQSNIAGRQKKEEAERASVQTLNTLFEKLRERIEAEKEYADALEEDCEYNVTKAREEEEEERRIDERIANNEAKAEELMALLEILGNSQDNEEKGKSL